MGGGLGGGGVWGGRLPGWDVSRESKGEHQMCWFMKERERICGHDRFSLCFDVSDQRPEVAFRRRVTAGPVRATGEEHQQQISHSNVRRSRARRPEQHKKEAGDRNPG